MVAALLGSLFNAGASILLDDASLAQTNEGVNKLRVAYELLTNTAQQFYASSITSNLELQALVRQSSIVIGAQTRLLDAAGNEVDDFTAKLAAIQPRIEQIQREIEITTRDIVGATTAQTNEVLNQVIAQFSVLQGQTKEFKDELAATPELVAGLTSALNTFQIPTFQFSQEIRSLLLGDINNPDSLLAGKLRDLGLTKEAIAEAQAAGTFIDLLNNKLESFAAANASAADSAQNAFSVIEDVTEQFFRSLGEQPTSGLERGLQNITELVADGSLEQDLIKIANQLGTPLGAGISEALAAVTEGIKNIVEGIGQERLEKMATQVGQLGADVLKIAADITVAITAVGAALATLISDVVSFGSAITNVLTLDFKLESNETELQGEFKEFEDRLSKPGVIRKVYDIIIEAANISPSRTLDIERIRRSTEQTLENLQNEIDAREPQVDFIVQANTQLANLDTTDLEEFRLNALEPIEDEINRFKNTINFDGVSEEYTTQINNLISNIESASDFSSAQREIRSLLSAAELGSEREVERLTAYTQSLAQRIDALRTLRDDTLRAAEAGNFVDDIAPTLSKINSELAELTEQQTKAAASSDPLVLAQRELVAGLAEGSEEYDKAIAKLRELEQAAAATGGGLVANLPRDFGNATIESFNRLQSALSAFTTTTGDTAQRTAEDFGMLLEAIEQAQGIGSFDLVRIQETLNLALIEGTLTAEQRVQVKDKLIQIIQQELQTEQLINDVRRTGLDLQVETGFISEEQAAVRNTQLDQQNKQLEIQAKQQELAVIAKLRETGAAEQLSKQLEQQLAAGNEVGAAETRRLQAMIEQGSEAERTLNLELEQLQIESLILNQKEKSLIIDEQLAEIAEQRAEATSRIANEAAQQELASAQARSAGLLEESVQARSRALELAKLEAESEIQLIDLEERRAVLNEALADTTLNQNDRMQFQQELLGLETQALETQARLVTTRFNNEEALRQVLEQRQAASIDSAMQTAEAAGAELSSKQQLNQALEESVQRQQEFLALSVSLQQSFRDLESTEISLRLDGIERLNNLDLSAINSGAEGAEKLRASVERTKDLLGIQSTGLSEILKLQARRNELETAGREQAFELQLQQLELEESLQASQLEAQSLQLDNELTILGIKREELELERQILEVSLLRAEAALRVAESSDEQQAAQANLSILMSQKDIIDSKLNANENIVKTTEQQVANNRQAAESLSAQTDIQRQIATNANSAAALQERITNEYELQDTILGFINQGEATRSELSSDTLEQVVPLGSESRDLGGFQVGAPQTGITIGTDPGNPSLERRPGRPGEQIQINPGLYGFTSTSFDRFTRILEERRRATEGFRVGGATTTNRVTDQEAIARSRTTEISQIIEQLNRLSQVRQTEDILRRTSELGERLEELFTSTSSNPQVLEISQRLDELRLMESTPEVQAEIITQTQLLQAILDQAKQADAEAVSLLEAIQTGAFQAGAFSPSNDGTVQLDPTTGELVVTGTRPDLEELNTLIDANNIAKQQLAVLESINNNTGGVLTDADVINNEQAAFTQAVSTPGITSGNAGITNQLATRGFRIGGGRTSSDSEEELGTAPNSGSAGIAAPTVINNFYPDQAGSVNSQLRSAGL